MKKTFLKNSVITMLGVATAFCFSVNKPSKVLATSENEINPQISYRAHVADIGWQDFVGSNSIAGTTGQYKGMEALEINLQNAGNAKIRYRAHVADIGWMDAVEADSIEGTKEVGTTGKAKSMEAIEIVLEGLDNYEVEYRAHVQDIGWQGWVKQGEVAGTTGKAKRIEALQIKLVKKEVDEEGILTYKPHVADIGWKTFKVAGGEEELQVSNPSADKIAGTTGQYKGLEALEINFDAPEGTTLKYRAHVADIGWQDFVIADNNKNTKFVGTTGQYKSIEAIQIVVEGLEDYEIKYRAHVSSIGWMNWVTASTSSEIAQGNFAGTTGKSLQVEAIEIIIVPHEHTWGDWYVTKKATCMEMGTQERICKICGETESKGLPADINDDSRHNWIDLGDKEALCTSDIMYARYECSLCGAGKGIVRKKAVGHNYADEYTIDEQPTCEQPGSKSRHCLRCDEKTAVTSIPALGHEFNNEYTIDKQPTCTQPGSVSQQCLRCGAKENVQTIPVTPDNHTWEVTTEAKEATCTEAGNTVGRTCTSCGKTERSYTISALGHEFTEIEYKDLKCESCTEVKTCSRCNQEFSEKKHFGTGHEFGEDNKCIHEGCNRVKRTTSGYIYFIFFSTDTNKSEPLAKTSVAHQSYVEEYIMAPEAKDGYEFEGWYNKITDKLISNEKNLKYSSEYADMFIEARYKDATE